MKRLTLIIPFLSLMSCDVGRIDNGRTKHCFNNLPEGVVININDLRNNSRLHIRKFNSTEDVITAINNDDYNLRLNTFNEGDTIINCNK